MKNKVAARRADAARTPMTAEQLAGHLEGLMSKVKVGSFGQNQFQALHEGRDPFAAPKQKITDVDDQIEWWRDHFKRLYHINPDFSALHIPKQVTGFDRLIIIPRGLTHGKWAETACTIHEISLYDENLDKVVTVNDRSPAERSYGIWIRNRQEADEELASKSADALATKVVGITLLERLVAGMGYLFKEMCHMDVKNTTLCSGSRYSGGSVPLVDWHPDYRKVDVHWYSPSHSHPNLRARAVVS